MQIVLGSAQYLREYGLLAEIGSYVKPFGSRGLLIGGKTGLSKVEEIVKESFAKYKIYNTASLWYGGESSQTQIDRLVEIVNGDKPDFLVGVGGGKALDTVKAVAYITALPLVVVPTIASTCAATTAVSVIYDDQGAFVEMSHLSKAADLVLVDTKVIGEAPVRFLSAGIGDTLAKWFESRASAQKFVATALNRCAVKIAEEIYQVLIEKGPTALADLNEGKMSQEVNDLIDCILFLSAGVGGYGGDACRTAAAHAIYSGLTIFPEIHQTYHGEIVAFGILAQLALEGRNEEEMLQLISYYEQVNLPSTLAEMGITHLSERDWERLGKVTIGIEDMGNMPFVVTPEMVITAIQTADQLGKRVSGR